MMPQTIYIGHLGEANSRHFDIDISELLALAPDATPVLFVKRNGDADAYAKHIGDRNDMVVQNIAVSGGTIAANTFSDSTARHWICRTIQNMDTNADYAIIQGGVNDTSSSVGVSLGYITDGFSDTFDDTTFCGAMESICKQLLLRFAGKKVGFIAVHKVSAKWSSSVIDSSSYFYAAKKCCQKWGIPFLDLNSNCPPFGLIYDSNVDLVPLRNMYTANGDGWHPTEEGYLRYYVPKIEAWMKTL